MTTPTPPPAQSPLTEAAISRLLLNTDPWLSCDDCFHRMDTHVEALHRGDTDHDPDMQVHLRGCAACAEEAASLLALLDQ